MGWSLRRSGREEYRSYLLSRAWGWRRQCWCRDCRRGGREQACQVCGARLDETGTLYLHRASYTGVTQDVCGRWQARAADADLLPLCREHHEELHRILDQRGRDYMGWNRRRASVVNIARLRTNHSQMKDNTA